MGLEPRFHVEPQHFMASSVFRQTRRSRDQPFLLEEKNLVLFELEIEGLRIKIGRNVPRLDFSPASG